MEGFSCSILSKASIFFIECRSNHSLDNVQFKVCTVSYEYVCSHICNMLDSCTTFQEEKTRYDGTDDQSDDGQMMDICEYM